jgi:hypothetical protein
MQQLNLTSYIPYQIFSYSGEYVSGQLPPELKMTPSLLEISIQDTLVEGAIPTDYAELSNLDTLILRSNQLTGNTPTFVFSLPGMVRLDLSKNSLTGSLPQTLSITEPNIRILRLEENEFSGSLSDQIIGQKMQELVLHNNQVTGAWMPNVTAEMAPNLRLVSIYNNDIVGDVEAICSLPNLKVFAADINEVTCSCCKPFLLDEANEEVDTSFPASTQPPSTTVTPQDPSSGTTTPTLNNPISVTGTNVSATSNPANVQTLAPEKQNATASPVNSNNTSPGTIGTASPVGSVSIPSTKTPRPVTAGTSSPNSGSAAIPSTTLPPNQTIVPAGGSASITTSPAPPSNANSTKSDSVTIPDNAV